MTSFSQRPLYNVALPRGGVLALGERPLVMGILNVTPDSFAEIRPKVHPASAIDAALRMEGDGADLIDIGGESTRPGAEPVTAEVELARLLPVFRALQGRLGIPMSVDTSKAVVAQAAVASGAVMVNDVTGLRNDPALGRVVAETGAALVLMHTRGTARSMNVEAVYADLIAEVTAELEASIRIATAAGVPIAQIIVDPGLGFAKRASHSYGVLARLPELASALGRPLLVGPSRKSFMQDAVGGRPAQDRDWGTAAAVTAAVLAGAHIVRVHAVAEMAQVVRVTEEIRRAGLRAER